MIRIIFIPNITNKKDNSIRTSEKSNFLTINKIRMAINIPIFCKLKTNMQTFDKIALNWNKYFKCFF